MKIVTVIGARPQFIKASVLSRLLPPSIQEVIIHTGQHYDENMSTVFLQQLGMPKPDYLLGVGSGTHARQTARMLEEIESILISEKPDMVVVYGDTNSTLAGGLAASKLSIPIAHIEAGLRSFNRNMPEEINRILTDHVSSLLFCPTQTAVDHLYHEGIRQNVHFVGDIMYDSVLYYKQAAIQHSTLLQRLGISPGQYYLSTIHRAENTDHPDRLQAILQALAAADQTVLLPLHPRTKKCIEQWQLQHLVSSGNIRCLDPVDYFDMLALESQAKLILTDSGGVQKEAYMLQIPCITLRDETEWVETVDTGWNLVTGANPVQILEAIFSLKPPAHAPNLFGDGSTGQQILNILQAFQDNRLRRP